MLIEKQTVKEVSRALRVSRRTVYKWVKRYQPEGVRGLEHRSSRPHRSPQRWDARLVRRVERLRRRRYTGYGSRRSSSGRCRQ